MSLLAYIPLVGNLDTTISNCVLFFYIVPVIICLPVYLVRIIKGIMSDIKRRSDSLYFPEVTIGSILLMVILSFTPLLNILASVFDCAGALVKNLYNFFERILNTPIIPKKKIIKIDS